MKTFVCTGCNETLEVCTEQYFKQPINGKCGDCWEDFARQDLEDQFEEAMEA